MSAELLAELTRRGVTLTAAGGRLQMAAPRGAITAELRQQVGAQKAALLALLSVPAPAGSGTPGQDRSAAPSQEAGDCLNATACAALREVLARAGRFCPRPPDPLWADPRPDLKGDHGRWTVLLALAWASDGLHPYGVYGALYGVRCCGAALVTDIQPLDLTPEGPPLRQAQDAALRWRLTRGEMPESEWQAYRARWLWPHKDVLIRLLQGGQST
jgi:hypothetical protein